MKTSIIFEDLYDEEDETKIIKRLMWVKLHSGIEGIGTFSVAGEVPEGSAIAMEHDQIVKQMLKDKQAEIKASNKKKLTKSKTK